MPDKYNEKHTLIDFGNEMLRPPEIIPAFIGSSLGNDL